MFVGSQRHPLSIAKMLMVIFLTTCGLVWSHQVNQYCERDSDHCSELLRLEDPHGYLDKHFKCKYPEVAECQQMAAFYDTGPEYQRYEHVTYFEPDDVDEESDIIVVPGKTHTMISKAIYPPIYEVEDFLTDEECDYIIERAKASGMTQSGGLGVNINVESQSKTSEDVSRISQQTLLYINENDKVVNSILDRVSKLTRMPRKYIQESEAIQVVSYEAGGHYHGHMDTTDTDLDEDLEELPCCHQTQCQSDLDVGSCCRVCRYITVLLYLNDVDEGGETAFPLADFPDKYIQEIATETPDFTNLSKHCGGDSVIVKPKKRKAIWWYNHEKDADTGLIGASIPHSLHGGCDVKKGTKWVANIWINVLPYNHWDKPSVFNV
ncbi:hypothetical protein ScPMuIL_000049 [Solemya velum]